MSALTLTIAIGFMAMKGLPHMSGNVSMSMDIPKTETGSTITASLQPPSAVPYTATVAAEIVRVKPSGEREVRGLSGRVAVRGQDRVRVEVRDERGNPVGQVIADGRVVWTLAAGSGRRRTTFRQEPLREGSVAAALTRGGMIGPEFAAVIAGKEPLAEEKAANIVTFSEPAHRNWEGIPVAVVTATFAAPAVPPQASTPTGTPGKSDTATPPKPPARTVTLVYRAADHRLVRVVSEQAQPDGSRIRRTETHTDIRVGGQLPDSLFVFTPPAGAIATTPRIIPPPPAVSSLPGDARPVPKNARYRIGSIGTDPVKSGITPSFQSGKRAAGPGNTGATEPATSAAYPLVVVPAADVLAPEPGQGVAQLGTLTALGARVVERAFVLKNQSEKPITLERLQETWGDLTVTVKDAEGASGPAALATRPALALPARVDSGKTVVVFARLDLANVPVGSFARAVQVYAREESERNAVSQGRPVTRLLLMGALKALVTFNPTTLTLGAGPGTAKGEGKPGQGATTRTVVATSDPELWEKSRAAGLGRPELVSQEPLVRMAVDPDSTGLNANQVRYTVSLRADGVTGLISTLPVLVPRPGNGKELDQSLALAYAKAAPFRIVADLAGEVTAQPRGVLFAAVSAEGSNTRNVTLTGKAGSLTGAEAHVESRSLSVRLTVAPGGGSATLAITRLSGAPAGTPEARVVVRLPKTRQVLFIPVVDTIPVAAPAAVKAAPPKRTK